MLKEMVQANRTRYCTDKIDGRHNYEEVYEQVIAEIKATFNAPCIMEVGVQRGGSIRLWADIFKEGRVLGLDSINGWRGSFPPDNAYVHICDAYTEESFKFVSNWAERYALIIDDGPHTQESQIRFVAMYSHLIAVGGIIMVEDIRDGETIEYLKLWTPKGFSVEVWDNRTDQRPWEMIYIARRIG